MEALTNHSTIRKFRNQPVTDEMIRDILENGIRASNTGNMQWYSIVVTTDKSILLQMAPLHFNQRPAVTAPVILTFCADINRFYKWCILNQAIPGYDNFLSFFNAATDALLAAQNVCVAAENFSLGICYLGTCVYNAAELIQLLQLPERVVPVTSVAIGWPDEAPRLTDRLPFEAVVHKDRYRDYGDEEIKTLYRDKENLASSLQFVLENGKNTLAQVFTDIRYKKLDNEYFSGKFLNTLKAQGFTD
jgi:nitroreductase